MDNMRYYTDMSRVVTIKSEKRGRLPVKIRLGKKNKQIVQLFPVPVLCLHSCRASKWGLDLRAQVLVARRLPGGSYLRLLPRGPQYLEKNGNCRYMFMYPHQLIGFTCKFVGSTRFVSGIKGPLSRTNKGLEPF